MEQRADRPGPTPQRVGGFPLGETKLDSKDDDRSLSTGQPSKPTFQIQSVGRWRGGVSFIVLVVMDQELAAKLAVPTHAAIDDAATQVRLRVLDPVEPQVQVRERVLDDVFRGSTRPPDHRRKADEVVEAPFVQLLERLDLHVRSRTRRAIEPISCQCDLQRVHMY